MILSENKANPIVDLLIKSAVETIKEKAGYTMPADEIEQELFDSEWIFTVNVDDEINYIDLTALVNQLDHIIARNIKYIFDEREEI